MKQKITKFFRNLLTKMRRKKTFSALYGGFREHLELELERLIALYGNQVRKSIENRLRKEIALAFDRGLVELANKQGAMSKSNLRYLRNRIMSEVNDIANYDMPLCVIKSFKER